MYETNERVIWKQYRMQFKDRFYRFVYEPNIRKNIYINHYTDYTEN